MLNIFLCKRVTYSKSKVLFTDGLFLCEVDFEQLIESFLGLIMIFSRSPKCRIRTSGALGKLGRGYLAYSLALVHRTIGASQYQRADVVN